jgi:hypothetical protein
MEWPLEKPGCGIRQFSLPYSIEEFGISRVPVLYLPAHAELKG